VGFIRFIRQHEAPEDDYLMADNIDHITVEEIYSDARKD